MATTPEVFGASLRDALKGRFPTASDAVIDKVISINADAARETHALIDGLKGAEHDMACEMIGESFLSHGAVVAARGMKTLNMLATIEAKDAAMKVLHRYKAAKNN